MRSNEQLALCQQWDSVAARTKVLKDARESAECINDSTLLHTQSRARHRKCFYVDLEQAHQLRVICRIREGSTTIMGSMSTTSMPNHGGWYCGGAALPCGSE